MAADSSLAFQQAVYAALAASAAVKALVGDPARVYDDVPEGAAFPYISIGDGTVADWGTKTTIGAEVTLTLHAWSRHGGRKEAKQILDAVHGALHQQPLAMAGHTPLDVRFEFAEDFLDEDGLTRHAVARYAVKTQTP